MLLFRSRFQWNTFKTCIHKKMLISPKLRIPFPLSKSISARALAQQDPGSKYARDILESERQGSVRGFNLAFILSYMRLRCGSRRFLSKVHHRTFAKRELKQGRSGLLKTKERSFFLIISDQNCSWEVRLEILNKWFNLANRPLRSKCALQQVLSSKEKDQALLRDVSVQPSFANRCS